jgi:hypothetical protein
MFRLRLGVVVVILIEKHQLLRNIFDTGFGDTRNTVRSACRSASTQYAQGQDKG